MLASVRVLLARLIDYAGLFPPARLPMEEAFLEYRAHHGGPESWMLARFVCPAARLSELSPYVTGLPGGAPPFMVAALADRDDDAGAFPARLDEGLRLVMAFLERHRRRAAVDQIEMRLPAEVLAPSSADAVAGFLAEIAGRLASGAPTPLLLAVEVPLAGRPREEVETAIAGVGAAARSQFGRRVVCLKLRCGGEVAAAVPSPGELAAALVAARECGLLLKATQGLHHPFRTHDPALGAPLHGFVNLLAAGLLARAHGLDEGAVADVLADETREDFAFSEDGLTWHGTRLTVDQIAAGRRFAIASLGSCSFAEPRDEARGLGLLAAPDEGAGA
jgi:hypothetical protein